MEKRITFGENSYLLNFTVFDNHIYLFDKLPDDIDFNDDQKWMHERTGTICDISLAGELTLIHAGDRHIGSSESNTLEYVSHEITSSNDINVLKVIQRNAKIEVTTIYEEHVKSRTLRSYNVVKNIGDKEVCLEYVSSFCKYDAFSFNQFENTYLYLPSNSWYMECQFKKQSFEQLGIIAPNPIKSFKKFCVSNTGAWSSKNYLPLALFEDEFKKQFTLIEIEANGSWSYEIGDYLKNVTLHISGPTLSENGWSKKLLPGESFESVKCTLTNASSIDEAFKNITLYRREILKGFVTKDSLPVIFNEYMHASWNCPSDETAMALGKAAKEVGADYFVIDCGWHDEEIDPFYYVGKWNESKKKYPNGLNNTLNKLRNMGLKVGLWLEPEVVGCLGDAHEQYDDDCYFQRDGKVLRISNRYQLDLRNDFVFNKLLNKFDEIMSLYHLDYVKLDYNIEPGIGTSLNSDSLGDGLLTHNRRYHDFIDELKKRYPNLVIESCASGGNRLDYYTLNNVDLVSSSDQVNYLIYPYIISNLLTATLPEQAGIWCYPVSSSVKLEEIDDECVIMNMVNCFIARIHLASKLYELKDEYLDLVKQGIDLYKSYTSFRMNSYPTFPLGFSSPRDSHLAFGIKNETKTIMCVYNMKGTDEIRVPLSNAKNVKLIYPNKTCDFTFNKDELIFKPEREKIARIFEIEDN